MKNLKYKSFFGKEVSHEESLRGSIKSGLVNLLMDEQNVSEKAFSTIDVIVDKVDSFLTDDLFSISNEMYNNGKRINYIVEYLFDSHLKNNLKHLQTFESFRNSKDSKEPNNINDKIKNLHKIPKELKDVAYNLSTSSTRVKNGKISELELHPDLKKKILDNNYPSGFSMGIDKDGFFIHTHRARSKSFESPNKISVKAIKFIDSTG